MAFPPSVLTISDAIRYAFRENETLGVPSTGGHEPIKAEIIEALTALPIAIQTLAISSAVSVSKATRANLYADLTWPENVLAIVHSDANADRNGIYIKLGPLGSGSWEIRFVFDVAQAAALAALQSTVEGLQSDVADLEAAVAGLAPQGPKRLTGIGGTADAITAATSDGQPANVYQIDIAVPNTAKNPTLAVNGEVSPRVIRSANGEVIQPGQLSVGSYLIHPLSSSVYRLLSPRLDGTGKVYRLMVTSGADAPDTLTATINPQTEALNTGDLVMFTPATSNTAEAEFTITVPGLPLPLRIRDAGGSMPNAGDIRPRNYIGMYFSSTGIVQLFGTVFAAGGGSSGTIGRLAINSGADVPNALTATLVNGAMPTATGDLILFRPVAQNTGPVTIDIEGKEQQIQIRDARGTALSAGDLQTRTYIGMYFASSGIVYTLAPELGSSSLKQIAARVATLEQSGGTTIPPATGDAIQNYPIWAGSAFPPMQAWDANTIQIIFIFGQSLATAAPDTSDLSNATTDPLDPTYKAPITTTPLHPGSALMFANPAFPNMGPWPHGRDVTGFRDLRETSDTDPQRFETPASSLADVVLTEMQARLGFKRPLLIANVGLGGAVLSQISRGSETWNEMVRLMIRAREIAEDQGKTVQLAGLFLLQGESEHRREVSPQRHARTLSRLLDDLQTEVRYRLAQVEKVRMVAALPSRGYMTGALRPSTAIEGIKLAARVDPRIVVSGPNYAAPHGAGGAHPTLRGYRRIGFTAGEACLYHFFATGWQYLEPIEWWWTSSTTLRIKFVMPGESYTGGTTNSYSSLVIDTTGALIAVPSGNGRGYRAIDAGGNVPINSVALTSGTTDTLDVTFANPPGADFRLMYAARGDGGGGDGGGDGSDGTDADEGGGSETGPRGVIRCNLGRTIPGDPVPVWHWAVPHIIRP